MCVHYLYIFGEGVRWRERKVKFKYRNLFCFRALSSLFFFRSFSRWRGFLKMFFPVVGHTVSWKRTACPLRLKLQSHFLAVFLSVLLLFGYVVAAVVVARSIIPLVRVPPGYKPNTLSRTRARNCWDNPLLFFSLCRRRSWQLLKKCLNANCRRLFSSLLSPFLDDSSLCKRVTPYFILTSFGWRLESSGIQLEKLFTNQSLSPVLNTLPTSATMLLSDSAKDDDGKCQGNGRWTRCGP